MTESEFWRSTPRQLARQLKGKSAQFRREHNERAWAAWHIAVLHRSKKLPPLKRMLMRDGNRKPQTWQQMQAAAKQWTVLLGGKIKPHST